MDKLEKAFARLSLKERVQIKMILAQIARDDFVGLNLEKLKGYADLFRVRKGNLRVIFRRDRNDRIFLLQLGRRKEDTYRYL